MKVIVLEDERLTAQRLIALLKKYDPSIHVIAELTSVEEAVDWFNSGETAEKKNSLDLIFMDIHLEDGNSFQIFERVQVKTPIIFTTAYDEYMVKAFKVNSIDYLLKPINYDELIAAIEKFKSLKSQFVPEPTQDNTLSAPSPNMQALLDMVSQSQNKTYKDRFMISVGTKIRSIKTSEIAFFYLEEKVIFLVTKENLTLPVDYSLDKLVQILDPREFFRVNRQYIVSLSSIDIVHNYSAGKLKIDLQPKPKHEVFVSGDRVTDFKEWLGK